MSSMKKAVDWLGLNEEYPDSATDPAYVEDGWDGDGASSETNVGPGPKRNASEASNASQPASSSPERQSGGVRAVPMDDTANAGDGANAGDRANAGDGANAGGAGSAGAAGSRTVRAIPLAETPPPQVVVPESFNNAQDVADIYKETTPVVVDLTNAERDLARRLIDFSAGLCYGLGGQMERLNTDLYLLIPDGAEVSAADRERFS